MSTPRHHIYEFEGFRFDADKLVLFYNDQLLKDVAPKPLEVLAAILSVGDDVATYDEIIERVWPNDASGADSLRIVQYVSKLKKLFAAHRPDVQFLENVTGRGYRFLPQAQHPRAVSPSLIGVDTKSFQPGTAEAAARKHSRRFAGRVLLPAAIALAAVVVASAAWLWMPEDEEKEVRHALVDSQMYESLVLYSNPAAFKEEELDKYWTRGGSTDEVNVDRTRILASVKKLQAEGLMYGNGTKCEQFDIQSINVDSDEQLATARTLERWFLAIYNSDGTPQKNKSVGPYFVDYILRKVDGRWLVEKSTTARMTRPLPSLTSIEAIGRPVSGSEFLVRISGKDIEPATLYLEIVGPGCPDAKPCQVPNSALLERAQITDSLIDNVPLTLTSGDFRIAAHNGDSPTSNYLYLKVP